MKNKQWGKIGFIIIFMLFITIPMVNFSIAQTNNLDQNLPILQQEYSIDAFNGNISTTIIERGQIVNFYATIGNFGDLVVPVVSLNANFTHVDGNTALNEIYTVTFDLDYRELQPEETFTATLMAEITNPEARYNGSIFFMAEDVYGSDAGPIEGAPAFQFFAAEEISVHVIDFGGASNVIVGIGITFAAAVVLVVLYILYGWLKERRAKRKY